MEKNDTNKIGWLQKLLRTRSSILNLMFGHLDGNLIQIHCLLASNQTTNQTNKQTNNKNSLLVEMFDHGRLYPNEDPAQVAADVSKQSKRPTIPSGLDPALTALIESCLEFDPNARPSMEKAVAVLSQLSKANPL